MDVILRVLTVCLTNLPCYIYVTVSSEDLISFLPISTDLKDKEVLGLRSL